MQYQEWHGPLSNDDPTPSETGSDTNPPPPKVPQSKTGSDIGGPTQDSSSE